MKIESAVLDRYSAGAIERQESLCCPVDYDPILLELLPQEIIEKDYGCGDPSRYVHAGDIVLDLGCGSGKVCYMAAQLVGKHGKVIGIDMNDDMLTLARKYQGEMAEKIGEDRVVFHKGYIQDLALDLGLQDKWLETHPVKSTVDLHQLDSWQLDQRKNKPLIEDNSVDLVISNCVLNLVNDAQKQQLASEIFRVIKPGGRMAISDIICDEPVPDELKKDEVLWSGCISGAFHELEILEHFVDAGFQSVRIDKWSSAPWKVVAGIEFRSVTVTGIKGSGNDCIDKGHAVIYRGPYSKIFDDEGHEFPRGERMAVCERTFHFLTEGPNQDDFIGIVPAKDIKPVPWCAPAGTRRSVSESKGGIHINKDNNASCC